MIHTTPRKLTPDHLGQRCTFRHLGLSMSGILVNIEPETDTVHDGTESDLILGPVYLVISDGWGISLSVPLPPDHPITLQENR